MKCRDVKGYLKYGDRKNHLAHGQIMAHVELCEKCRDTMVLETLTTALLKAHSSAVATETNPAENNYLMTRIMARIRELSEQGVGSWESAVFALRGWLIAFGAAAILLLSISVQWQLPNSTNATDQDYEMTALSSISEDYISGTLKSPETFTPTDEAVTNANK
ncbi:MAG: hypothetical protein L0226_12510 [Acidobacteria bacterium]|nr:hypothetical protein [Acidobacteriota bacterium]